MTGSPATAAPPVEQPPGIVCRVCLGTRWRVIRTRKGPGTVRRFRRCMGCAHRVRTREVIEAEPHPDHDAR